MAAFSGTFPGNHPAQLLSDHFRTLDAMMDATMGDHRYEVTMTKKRAHVWIRGRVQGVFFRAYTRDAASKEKVKGWVRNLPDGRVEAVFEGDEENVDRILAWCHNGSPLSRVDHLEVQEEPYRGEFDDFGINYLR
jgi:acylphosphatase